jgi:hypothetical protein
MEISTLKYFRNPDENPLQFNPESNGRAISAGLGLVACGYGILVAGGVIGSVLVWQALEEAPSLRRLGVPYEMIEGFLPLGVTIVALTALLSYGLVMLGHWRCVIHAPQQKSGRMLMYTCLNLVVLASVMYVLGAYREYGRTYLALQRGWREVAQLDPLTTGNLLQGVAALLGVISLFFFSLFLRGVASCFHDRAGMRHVDLYLVFVALLVGGSLGTYLCSYHLVSRALMLSWIASGWLLCFAWHVFLIRRIRRCVEDGLRRGLVENLHQGTAGTVKLHRLSGLYRIAMKKADDQG